MSKRDYYEVLGVSRDATDTEIKKSFRRIARELHPDVNGDDPDAEEKFKEAAEAYEVLSDPQQKQTYDAYGHEGVRSGGFNSQAQGFSSVEDLFGAFFGGGGFGGGRRDPRGDRRGGAGELRSVANTAFGQMVRATPCDKCRGEGKIAETPCKVCSGLGRKHTEKSWKVDVPAGIESGQRIRIAGAGHAGEPGAPAGDLYVEVGVNERDGMIRDGQDLITVVAIDVTKAMTGETIEVETLDGSEEIEAKAGTQPGAETALKGKGLPRLGSSRRRGDHRFVFKVIVPANLDEDQISLVEQLDGSLTDENRSTEDSGLFARMRRAWS